jgi:hypothetical protein
MIKAFQLVLLVALTNASHYWWTDCSKVKGRDVLSSKVTYKDDSKVKGLTAYH